VRRLPFVSIFGQDQGQVELYIDRGAGTSAENKEIFDRLSAHKAEVERIF
jgi:hypothetical protein